MAAPLVEPPPLPVKSEAPAPSGRVEALLGEVAAAPSVARAAERAQELVRALVEFYGDGLEKLLTIVHDAAGDRSEAIFDALCADRYVEGLLVLHNLHPLSLEDRVRAALATVRPYLASHDGDVEFLGVDDGVAVVRLIGNCDGCPASSATLTHAVESAILERIPEVTTVRAEASDALDPLLPRVLNGNGRGEDPQLHP